MQPREPGKRGAGAIRSPVFSRAVGTWRDFLVSRLVEIAHPGFGLHGQTNLGFLVHVCHLQAGGWEGAEPLGSEAVCSLCCPGACPPGAA